MNSITAHNFYAEASSQELLDACNNNVANTYACVQLGLHKFIVTSSTKLQGAVKSFAHFVKRKQGPSVLPALIRHDAPRMVGDIFAASGAAVCVDSGWDKFEEVFQPIREEHLLCLVTHACDEQGQLKQWVSREISAKRQLSSFELRECRPTDVTNLEVLEMALDASTRCSFDNVKLALGPPACSEAEAAEQENNQRNNAFYLTDFHIFQAFRDGDTKLGPPVMATSPRAASPWQPAEL